MSSTLDNYEEGEFVVKVKRGKGVQTLHVGRYTRIGEAEHTTMRLEAFGKKWIIVAAKEVEND